jgi:serine/threonine-protein kinase RsbW
VKVLKLIRDWAPNYRVRWSLVAGDGVWLTLIWGTEFGGCRGRWLSRTAIPERISTMVCGAGGVVPVGTTELHTLASASAIPTIRLVAAHLAARADFDLDSIEDLRMAVNEACALLVPIAAGKGRLSCGFTVRPHRVELVVEVEVDDAADSFTPGSLGWRVLNWLAGEVNALVLPAEAGQHGLVCITLAKDAATHRG